MPKETPFDQYSDRYEAWFDMQHAAYVSELLALRIFVPLKGLGLEIGVGSGKFAAALGIRVGIDASLAMLALARARGIDVVRCFAEKLPFAADEVESLLMVAVFRVLGWDQTLTRPVADSRDIEPAQPSHGDGASVVVMAGNDKPAGSGARLSDSFDD